MARAMLLVLAFVALASGARYVDYSGAKMPEYSGTGDYDHNAQPDPADDYHEHLPDVPTSDYKYEEDSIGRTNQPRLKNVIERDVEDPEIYQKSEKKLKRPTRLIDDANIETLDKYSPYEMLSKFKQSNRLSHKKSRHSERDVAGLPHKRLTKYTKNRDIDVGDQETEDHFRLNQEDLRERDNIEMEDNKRHFHPRDTTVRAKKARRKQRDRFVKSRSDDEKPLDSFKDLSQYRSDLDLPSGLEGGKSKGFKDILTGASDLDLPTGLEDSISKETFDLQSPELIGNRRKEDRGEYNFKDMLPDRSDLDLPPGPEGTRGRGDLQSQESIGSRRKEDRGKSPATIERRKQGPTDRKIQRINTDAINEEDPAMLMKLNKMKMDEEYDDYYDMKRLHHIKNKMPTLLRRSTTKARPTVTRTMTTTTLPHIEWPNRPFDMAPNRPVDMAPNQRVIMAPNRRFTMAPNHRFNMAPNRRFNMAPIPNPEIFTRTTTRDTFTPSHTITATDATSTAATTTTTTTDTTTTTEPVSQKSTISKQELSLAEKSRLSILRKSLRKESRLNDITSKTKKPPVLLQLATKMQTVVIVEPASAAPSPLMRARLVSGDSPSKLDQVKRLMRRKLVANARNIQELTDNWDDMVCDYIDTSLLETSASTHIRVSLFLLVSVSFIVIYFSIGRL